MAKQSMQLDPNAVTYSDDEIVGKVNSASANITRASSVSAAARPIAAGEVGATELAAEEFTTAEQTKLTGIDAGAEVNPADLAELDPTANTKLSGIEESATADQTGAEVQTAILGLADADRKLIKTDPQTGEFTVLALQRDTDGNLDVDYDDVAV